MPRRRGYILAGNHTSFLDPVILGLVSLQPLNFMAKQELFGNVVFGRLITALGAFPVLRRRIDIGAVREAIRRLKNGGTLLLFPEGTRTSGEKTARVFPGVGILSLKADVPIVPVLIIGAERALPKKACWVRFCPLKVYFLERIIPRQVIAFHTDEKENYALISKFVMERIQEAKRKYGN